MTEETKHETNRNLIRRLYDWVLNWAESKYGSPALFLLAFAESSFFPIPADVLLIALCMGKPKRSLFYAGLCTVGSVLGGIFGYLIGWLLMDSVGTWLFNFYGGMENYQYIQELYQEYDAWAVFIAGFTPIPYKIFTIAAGMFKISFPVFTVASILGRGGRFFLVAGLIFAFGPKIKTFIEKYFNLMVIIFTFLLLGGFILIKFVSR